MKKLYNKTVGERIILLPCKNILFRKGLTSTAKIEITSFFSRLFIVIIMEGLLN